MGSRPAKTTLTVPADRAHRLLLAARCGLPGLGHEVQEKLHSFLTLENFAFMVAFIAADMLFAGTGVGTLVNVVAVGFVIVFFKSEAITGYSHLRAFYLKASDARSDDDFRAAGIEFAKAVSAIGVDSVIALLTLRSGARSSGKLVSRVSPAELEASWFAYIDSLKFDVDAGRGIIWARIGQERAINIAQAMSENPKPAYRVINQLLDQSGFTRRYQNEFGQAETELTYRIWERVSMRYVASLKGVVTAYVDTIPAMSGKTKVGVIPDIRITEGKLQPGKGAGTLVVGDGGKVSGSSVLLTELEELIESNPRVTAIKMIDAKSGRLIGTYTRGAGGTTTN